MKGDEENITYIKDWKTDKYLKLRENWDKLPEGHWFRNWLEEDKELAMERYRLIPTVVSIINSVEFALEEGIEFPDYLKLVKLVVKYHVQVESEEG